MCLLFLCNVLYTGVFDLYDDTLRGGILGNHSDLGLNAGTQRARTLAPSQVRKREPDSGESSSAAASVQVRCSHQERPSRRAVCRRFCEARREALALCRWTDPRRSRPWPEPECNRQTGQVHCHHIDFVPSCTDSQGGFFCEGTRKGSCTGDASQTPACRCSQV